MATLQERDRAVGRPGQREQAVAVDHGRDGCRGDQLPHPRGRGLAPTQPRPHHEGLEAVEVLEDHLGPRADRQRAAHDLRRQPGIGRGARAGEPDVPGPRPHRGRRRQAGGSGHARRAGDHGHRGVPLVRVDGARQQPLPRIVLGHQVGASPAHVEADVRQLDLAGGHRTRRQEQPRLQRSKGHRPVRGKDTVAGPAGRAVDAARDVDGEHRGGADVGRRPRAVEARAERGVDHEVGRRQPGRSVGDVDHPHGRARTSQAPRRRPTVVAVVALPGEDDDATPVRPAHHPSGGARHGGARPLDQDLDRLRRGSVDLRHLGRRDHRDHRPTVPRAAPAPLDVTRPLGAGATASAVSTAGRGPAGRAARVWTARA